MKRILTFSLLLFTSYFAHAITATKAYVDSATNATLAASKAYTDSAVVAAGAVTPSIATNIAGSVTSNVVTKSYVEGLGVTAGLTTNDVQGIVEQNVQTNYLARKTSGSVMFPGAIGVTMVKNGSGAWGVDNAAWASYANSAGSTATLNFNLNTISYSYPNWRMYDFETGIYKNIASENYVASAVAGMSGKRDLTNNVCAATSATFGEWSRDNLPSGVTWAAQPTYDASIDLWEWGYGGGTAQSEEGGEDATSLTFGYGAGFTTTRTATKIAISNDTFTTYGFVTNAIANASPDLSSRTTFAQVTNIAESASVTNAGAAAYADAKDEGIKAIVQTWEGFLDGSNVVFSITNYISGSYNLDVAKLRILEMTNNVYREVYNSRGEIVMHLDSFKTNDFRIATNAVVTSLNAQIAAKADKAWGKYTSAGGEAPSNTVYMTAPNTVFAGGMEYERVAVGEGSVCVLTTKGAPTYTAGDEGTFKFQDDGGTNYFGFAKTDSYTIGANTDGISVASGIVTLTYNVTMSGVPCIWYTTNLTDSVSWEQLNLPDGTPVSGASHAVSWEQSPPAGKEICYIICASEPEGFFKATIEVEGSAKFMTNMPADLGGGIICTNTATGVNGVIRPTYNGSAVQWSWSAR